MVSIPLARSSLPTTCMIPMVRNCCRSRALLGKLERRIGKEFLDKVEEMRAWLPARMPDQVIDMFLHDLFAQLLSQRRFQPEPDIAGAAVCDWLVQTATRLRTAAQPWA